jgi:hypothetical protein
MNALENQNMNANPRRSIPWVCVGACVWLCLLSVPAFAQEEPEIPMYPGPEADQARSRERFLAIERIARLPATEQALAIPGLYKKTAYPILHPSILSILSGHYDNILVTDKPARSMWWRLDAWGWADRWAAQMTAAEKDLTPEQMADRISPDPNWLNAAAWSRTIVILKAHPKITESLLDADLRSANAKVISRAAGAIRCLQWRQFNAKLMDPLWSENEDIYGPAMLCLCELADVQVKEKLLEKLRADPRSIERSGSVLRFVMQARKVEPAVLALLESPDDKVRQRAAEIVCTCPDEALGPHAARLASDANAKTRHAVAEMLVAMPDETFRSIRRKLLPLLDDENLDVRYRAALEFAKRREVVAGPVILSALKSPMQDMNQKVIVLGALAQFDQMAGKIFDYNLHEWGRDKARNRKAIEEFERWLSERVTMPPT